MSKNDRNQAFYLQISEIYYIKDSTDDKSEIEMVDTIQNELKIFDDEELVPNKIIYALAQINICEAPNLQVNKYNFRL